MTASEDQINLHSFHSDVYKEKYGVRPHWLRPEEYTADEWQWMIGLMIEEEQELNRLEAEHTAAHQAWVAQVTDTSPLKVKFPAFQFS